MLRELFKSDIAAVFSIEQAVHVVPWTIDTFQICFRAGYKGWVLEEEKQVLGFVIVSFVADECHILNLCVARQAQHQGYGKVLLAHALEEAKKASMHIAYLEVRRSNGRAIQLYKKANFQLVGERKDYYPTQTNQQEDALVFAKSLGQLS